MQRFIFLAIAALSLPLTGLAEVVHCKAPGNEFRAQMMQKYEDLADKLNNKDETDRFAKLIAMGVGSGRLLDSVLTDDMDVTVEWNSSRVPTVKSSGLAYYSSPAEFDQIQELINELPFHKQKVDATPDYLVNLEKEILGVPHSLNLTPKILKYELKGVMPLQFARDPSNRDSVDVYLKKDRGVFAVSVLSNGSILVLSRTANKSFLWDRPMTCDLSALERR